MSDEQDQKKTTNFERHVQSALAVIGVAILLGIGKLTLEIAVNMASMSSDVTGLKSEMNIQISALKVQIQTLQNMTLDRYTKTDAIRDFEIRDEDIRENRDAIKALQRIYTGGPVPR